MSCPCSPAPPAAAPEPAPKAKKVAKKTEKRKATEDASPIAVKKQKAVVPKKAAAAAATPSKPAKGAKSKAGKKKAVEEEDEEEVAQKEEAEEQEPQVEADEVEEGDEVDEKTQALVQKLDSGDEQEDDEEGAGKKNIGTYKKGQAVGKAPKVAALAKKNPSEPVDGENRGTIYVGHVPFGCVFFLFSLSLPFSHILVPHASVHTESFWIFTENDQLANVLYLSFFEHQMKEVRNEFLRVYTCYHY